jgi:peptidoglycan/xylan/chitin deacetylase (PgdA/CDA1 family)
MSNWKTKLIQAYRLCSQPYRQFRWANMARQGSVPIIVLFYHRVADDHPNPWTISRSSFLEQINWFQEKFDIVDLEECQRRIASGNNTRPTLAITFDDGYAENCEYAIPLLVERKIPATYFVTVHHTTNQQPFPHDVERNQPLPTNSPESLVAMDRAGIEIAAHGRTHADLGKITDEQVLIDEVIASSLELEAILGRKVRYFAFPFGKTANLNDKVFGMLREAGFKGVCSAYGGWNEIGDDSFHLQRLHGDPNFERMKNWLTFDPRIEGVSRYTPQNENFDRQLFQAAIESAKHWADYSDGSAPASVSLPISTSPAAGN